MKKEKKITSLKSQYKVEWEGVRGVGDGREQAVVSQLLKPPWEKAGVGKLQLAVTRTGAVMSWWQGDDRCSCRGRFQIKNVLTGDLRRHLELRKLCSWPCRGDRSVTAVEEMPHRKCYHRCSTGDSPNDADKLFMLWERYCAVDRCLYSVIDV